MLTVYRNDHSYCGPISMLEKLPNGDLVAVFREALWRGVVTHGDPTTRTSMVRSTDGGSTWHSLVTPDPAGGNGTAVGVLGDGSLLVNNFHWLFVPLSRKQELASRPGYREIPLGLAMALDGVYTCRSKTDGYTWEAPRRMDQQGFFALSTAGRVVEMGDGSLLLPLNARRSDRAAYQCVTARSFDGGETWEELHTVTAEGEDIDFHESRIVGLGGGRLVAMHRTEKGPFYQSFSDDGGSSWSAASPTPIWCGGSSPADLLLLEDGRLLCTYGHRRRPYGVRVCLSDDGGRTWNLGDEKILRKDGLDRDMGYPSSQQLEDGTVLTVYYWHGEDQVRYLKGTFWTLD